LSASAKAAAAAAIELELSTPRSFRDLLAEIEDRFPDLGPLAAVLREKEAHARVDMVLRAEELVARRLGWRLVRPLVGVAFLGGVGFLLQREVEPVLGVTLFLAGAGSMYAATQLLLALRRRSIAKRDAFATEEYRRRLRALR